MSPPKSRLKGLRPGEDRTSAALFCGPATACLQPDPSYKCLRIVQIGRKAKKEGNEATNPHSHFDFPLVMLHFWSPTFLTCISQVRNRF